MDDAIVLRTMPQMIQATAKTIEATMKILLEIAAQNRDNALVNELLEHSKLGGNIDLTICRSFAVKDFDEKLTQHNIPHAIIYNKVTNSMAVMTRDIDREAVLAARNELFVEQKRLSRLSLKEFTKINSGKNIEIIRDRDADEAKLFQQTAKKYGLSNVAFQKNSANPNKIDIYYTSAEREKAQAIWRKVALSTVGLSGERTTARISREIEFQNDQIKDAQDYEKDFYVVSKSNHDEYIHFNKDGFQYFKNGVLTRDEQRSSDNFATVARSYLSGIVNPVSLSKKEFEVPTSERDAKIDRMIIPTDLSEFNKHRLELEQSARELIDRKISIDATNKTSIQPEFYSVDASFGKLFVNDKALTNQDREKIEKLDNLSCYERAAIKNYIGRELVARDEFVKSLNDRERDFYVVSKNNPYEFVHFTKDGLQHYKNSKLIDKCDRNSSRFEQVVLESTRLVEAPVTLSKEQFEVSNEERRNTLRAERSPLDSQSRRIETLEQAARQLVEMKFSHDNDESIQIPNSFYNSDVSFGEFVEIDRINDDEKKELVNTLDKLEDKEKILIKSYIKDSFEKVESLEINAAYVDPELRENDLDADIERVTRDEQEIDLPGSDEYDFDIPDIPSFGDDD